MLDLPVHRVALLAGQNNGVGPLVDMLGRAGLACLRGSDLSELDGDGPEQQPEAALVDLASIDQAQGRLLIEQCKDRRIPVLALAPLGRRVRVRPDPEPRRAGLLSGPRGRTAPQAPAGRLPRQGPRQFPGPAGRRTDHRPGTLRGYGRRQASVTEVQGISSCWCCWRPTPGGSIPGNPCSARCGNTTTWAAPAPSTSTSAVCAPR